jgi:hypothetical protein
MVVRHYLNVRGGEAAVKPKPGVYVRVITPQKCHRHGRTWSAIRIEWMTAQAKTSYVFEELRCLLSRRNEPLLLKRVLFGCLQVHESTVDR